MVCVCVCVCVKGKGAHQAATKCGLRKRAQWRLDYAATVVVDVVNVVLTSCIRVVASANFKNKTTVSGGHRHERVSPGREKHK